MFVSKINAFDDPKAITEFIKANSFGTLITHDGEKPVATHIPIELEENEKGEAILTGHIAKANQQWKTFEQEGQVLVTFMDYHAYISSSWYAHENVPTWNYVAVHVYGKIKIIEGQAVYDALKRLTDKYEAASKEPFRLETMNRKNVDRQIRGIVGFEITIEKIEASKKLSQNRNEADHQHIIEKLEERGDYHSVKIAEEMRQRK